MIKFRNCGCDIVTQVGIMKVLYDEFEEKIFGLEEFATAIANHNLMTAYGYTGEMAMSRSNVKDKSRDSAKMNVKMYAEIFRFLGWLSSCKRGSAYKRGSADKRGSAYPLIVTELGKYIATSPNPVRLYEQCVLGINHPQEVVRGVKYKEHVRFFVCALRALKDLDGVMYKHELCMGPMSVNDDVAGEYDSMIRRLRDVRTGYTRYEAEWARFCDSLKMEPRSVDNQTRFPLGALRCCGLVDEVRSEKVYPPKRLKCMRLTDHGKELLGQARACKDLRLDEFNSCDKQTQDALIRLGFYQMLGRANYDLTPIEDLLLKDKEATASVTQGRELLFSPYQTLGCWRVNEALGIDVSGYRQAGASSVGVAQRGAGETTRLTLTTAKAAGETRSKVARKLKSQIVELDDAGKDENEIVDALFSDAQGRNQGWFYPRVGEMFKMLGFDCCVSRPGDNGSRMDAIITGPGNAIPIEIKSPGEEEFISIKAVKQAAENKIILLSRKKHPTSTTATSLVVGYHAPNERAEVSDLIDAFESVYGIRIGVMSYDVLARLVVRGVLKGQTITSERLEAIRGFADVASE